MWFLVPALLINLVIILIPALLTVAMAFANWDGVSAPSFAGLDNFRAILKWNNSNYFALAVGFLADGVTRR